MAFRWTEKAVAEMTRLMAEGLPASAIAQALGCRGERTVVRKQLELGLRKRQTRKPWTRKEAAAVRTLYADMSTAKLARQLGRTESQVYQCAARMGLKKSEAYLASPEACRLRRGGNVGAAFRYPKGHVPANFGLRRPGWSPGRMRETQFKRGERSGFAERNWKPVGTIVADSEGFMRVKIKEREASDPPGWCHEVWPLLHWRTWEQHHGPIPGGHAVVFKNGKRSDCAIENLELISRGDLMRRNTIHARYPPDLKKAIMLLGAVKRKVRENAEKLNDGSAQPSV